TVDTDWQEAQGRRQAFYTNVNPGAHRFRVIAANNDGVWNDTGATLDFVIPPTFVQTGWFVALCVLATATAIFLLIRLRYRQMAATAPTSCAGPPRTAQTWRCRSPSSAKSCRRTRR